VNDSSERPDVMDLGTWRPTVHDQRAPGGERCRCAECAPPPTLSVYEALRSPLVSRERDLQIAAWRRLRPDEVPAYLAYLRLYDTRKAAYDEDEATAELLAARYRRITAESEGDVVRLRGKGLHRLKPRASAA